MRTIRLSVGISPVMKAFTVRALDESTWPAFAELVERNNGVFGGCWCMGIPPRGGGVRKPPRNSTVSGSSSVCGQERPMPRSCSRAPTAWAWRQFGAPSELPRIKSRAAYEKGLTTATDWRIACNFVGKGHRRQGVATAGLEGAFDLIAVLGGGTVEGYPEDAASVPAGFLFNGALSTYEGHGDLSATARSASTAGSSPRSSNRSNDVDPLSSLRRQS